MKDGATGTIVGIGHLRYHIKSSSQDYELGILRALLDRD